MNFLYNIKIQKALQTNPKTAGSVKLAGSSLEFKRTSPIQKLGRIPNTYLEGEVINQENTKPIKSKLVSLAKASPSTLFPAIVTKIIQDTIPYVEINVMPR